MGLRNPDQQYLHLRSFQSTHIPCSWSSRFWRTRLYIDATSDISMSCIQHDNIVFCCAAEAGGWVECFENQNHLHLIDQILCCICFHWGHPRTDGILHIHVWILQTGNAVTCARKEGKRVATTRKCTSAKY